MATLSNTHRFLTVPSLIHSSSFSEAFEFDESDVVWSSNEIPGSQETRKLASNPIPIRKPVRKNFNEPVGPRSVPVNVPDWAKILRGAYTPRAAEYDGEWDDDVEGDVDGGNDKMPPHEYLARTRVASFSVHEGVGRTLKGRDMSRVRNAIWKQIGFED